MITCVRFCLLHDSLKRTFISFKMNISWMWKRIVDTDVVTDVTYSRQSVITRVVIRFLWHDVSHWITATSYDKKKTDIEAIINIISCRRCCVTRVDIINKLAKSSYTTFRMQRRQKSCLYANWHTQISLSVCHVGQKSQCSRFEYLKVYECSSVFFYHLYKGKQLWRLPDCSPFKIGPTLKEKKLFSLKLIPNEMSSKNENKNKALPVNISIYLKQSKTGTAKIITRPQLQSKAILSLLRHTCTQMHNQSCCWILLYSYCLKFQKIMEPCGFAAFWVYYPLAQQSCGGDIGSVSYVRTYVRSYVHLF